MKSSAILKYAACLASLLAAAQSMASDYDVISVGSDPSQDDGAISITDDEDSTTIHMGGDPSHGIYHNPSQQNEYVMPSDGWRGGCWDGSGYDGRGQGGRDWDGDGRMHRRHMHGRGYGPSEDGRGGYCPDARDDCGYGY
ncbi:MAG: hypothetical protein ACI4NA_06135 [Succinivibrio sp.]